jgi:hypothetical protein
MLDARPTDPEPRLPTLFEDWMGMTAQEWDALGAVEDGPDDEPRLL